MYVNVASGVLMAGIGVVMAARGVVMAARGVVMAALGVVMAALGVVMAARGVVMAALGVVNGGPWGCNGGPWGFNGNHKDQFPVTDLAPWRNLTVSSHTAKTSKATFVWGIKLKASSGRPRETTGDHGRAPRPVPSHRLRPRSPNLSLQPHRQDS